MCCCCTAIMIFLLKCYYCCTAMCVFLLKNILRYIAMDISCVEFCRFCIFKDILCVKNNCRLCFIDRFLSEIWEKSIKKAVNFTAYGFCYSLFWASITAIVARCTISSTDEFICIMCIGFSTPISIGPIICAVFKPLSILAVMFADIWSGKINTFAGSVPSFEKG